MRNLREFGSALIVAFISIGLIIGTLSISLVEFSPEATPSPTNIIQSSPLPITATITLPAMLIPIQGLESSTASITPTLQNAGPLLSCQPPLGWLTQIEVQAGDTLEILAARYRIGSGNLRQANCLVSDTIVTGMKLYVPPVSTNTPAVCNKGASGWLLAYTVKAGDTIYAIATNHYSTANLLKSVNCKTSDLIFIGEVLWVPNIATRTPYPTPLPGVTGTTYPTEPLTQTALPFTVTVIPSNTSVPATATPMTVITTAPTFITTLTSFP